MNQRWLTKPGRTSGAKIGSWNWSIMPEKKGEGKCGRFDVRSASFRDAGQFNAEERAEARGKVLGLDPDVAAVFLDEVL